MVLELPKQSAQRRVVRRDEMVPREIEKHIVPDCHLARLRRCCRVNHAGAATTTVASRVGERVELPAAHEHEQLARTLRHSSQHVPRSRLRHPSARARARARRTHTHTVCGAGGATTCPQRRHATQRGRIRARQLGIVPRERGQIVPQPPTRQKLCRRPQQRRVDVVHRPRDLHALQRRQRAQQRSRLGRAERRRVHVVYDEDQPAAALLPPPGLLLPRRGRGWKFGRRVGEELRDTLYALWSAWQTRQRGDDVPRGERGQKPIEDEDVSRRRVSVSVPGGSTSAGEVVERVALRSEAVEYEVKTLCELKEVAW